MVVCIYQAPAHSPSFHPPSWQPQICSVWVFVLQVWPFLTYSGFHPRYADDTTPPYRRGEEELKSLFMELKEEREKAGLKLNIQKTKIMASGPITSWQIVGETVETVRNFIFLCSKITADGDCSHEIKRRLLLGRKAIINLDSILKSRNVTLLTKGHLVSAVVFPVVMYGCDSWTIKKAEHQRIDAFELWCWKRLLRVTWIGRRSRQEEKGTTEDEMVGRHHRL